MSRLRLTPLFPLLLGGTIAVADELELVDGGRLSGTVQSITDTNLIRTKLQIAEQPVDLHATQVVRVRFGNQATRLDHDTMLTLVNGDKLPCDLLAVTPATLEVETSYAGNLIISREVVTTAQLGIRPRKVFYNGPSGLKGWKVGDNWHYEDGALVSSDRGSISREFSDLPDSFSLSFLLKWSRKPQFKFYFASADRDAGGGNHDRYFVQFNDAGLSLHRQSSGIGKSHALITVDRSINRFENNQTRIEIRYDRGKQMIQLLVDGQFEGRAADPLDLRPEGHFVIFHSDGARADTQKVSSLQIKEWDAAGERHRSEDRGDPGKDALINNEGQRFGGDLIESMDGESGMTVRFKSPLAPDALEIPANEVSTLFFREVATDDLVLSPLTLGIGELGTLSASDCTFTPDQVTLNHPLLGDLALERAAIRLLQRRTEEENETPNESEE